MMQIAVIIVNYGTADLAIEAVESVLERDHGGHDVEVHLVDNASPGDDAATFAARAEAAGWGPRVILWPETENHGFGRGNNVVLHALAVREAPPDFVFLLNPDAKLENDVLTRLAAEMEAHPDTGAVGAGIVDPADNKRVVASFRFPTALGQSADMIGLGPVSRLLERYRTPMHPETPAGVVDWVSGACVMFRFDPIREAGFFDPGFFLYYEEVDLMRRLTEAGWTIRYQPEAVVAHIAGAATDVKGEVSARRRRPDFLYRSWRRYFTNAHGPVYALIAALGLTLSLAIGRGLAVTLRRHATQHPLYFYRDQWRYVIAPLMGLRTDAGYTPPSDH